MTRAPLAALLLATLAPAAPAQRGNPPPSGKERAVAVEVILADIGKAEGASRPDYSGPAAEVSAKLDELAKGNNVRRVRLTATEGKEVQSRGSAQVPMTTSVAAGGRGGAPVRSVSFVSVGLTVRVTATVGPDNGVTLDLTVEDAKVGPPGGNEEPAPVESNSLTTRVKVPAGRAVVASETWAEAKGGRSGSVIVVLARVLDGGEGK